VAEVEWFGEEIRALITGDVMEGLVLGGEHLLQVSRTEVPIDEATLERSGAVTQDDENLAVAVAYSTPYAERQHEDLTLRHADGRKGKYLEDPMNTEKPTILAIIATRARRSLQ
jgi:hypothetical protein